MPRATIADLSIEEFRQLVREVVLQTLADFIGDPDEGLELKDDLKAELQRSLAAVEAGDETVPVGDVAERLGLLW